MNNYNHRCVFGLFRRCVNIFVFLQWPNKEEWKAQGKEFWVVSDTNPEGSMS